METAWRLGLPQAQQRNRIGLETGYRCIVGHTLDDPLGYPANPHAAVIAGVLLRVAAQHDLEGGLGPREFPGVAELQPVIGALDLPAILDLLFEDAVLVANAVADGRDLQGCQRIQKTGGQPAQPAVA